MNAVIYARVSTAQQEDEGTSLDTQVDACMEFANSMGYIVGDGQIWRDQGSGSDPDRPGLVHLKSALAVQEVDAVIVFTPDRIARDPVHLMLFREYLEGLNLALHFVHGPSGDSPEERLIEYFLGYVGQKERIDITERTMRGKRRVAESGRLPIGTGHGLFGYDYDRESKTRVVNPHESAIVQYMFREYLNGKTSYRIACELNESGVKTKRGHPWHNRTVENILTNPCFKGVTWYGKARHQLLRGGKVKRTELPRDEWILVDGFTPAIVSETLWEQVQDRLAMPKSRPKGDRQKYMLTGFIRCAQCDTPMVGASRHGKYRYYSCRATRKTAVKPATCNARAVNADKLEVAVWEQVSAVVMAPSHVRKGVQEFLESGDEDLGRECKRLRRKIGKAKDKERKLLTLFTKDVIDEDALMDQVAPIRMGRKILEQELEDLQGRKTFNDGSSLTEARIHECESIVREQMARMDLETVRAALTAFDVKVFASKTEATIEMSMDGEFVLV